MFACPVGDSCACSLAVGSLCIEYAFAEYIVVLVEPLDLVNFPLFVQFDSFHDGSVCPVVGAGVKNAVVVDESLFLEVRLVAFPVSGIRISERFVVELVYAIFDAIDALEMLQNLAVPGVTLEKTGLRGLFRFAGIRFVLETVGLFEQDAVIVPFFPDSGGVPVFIVMFFEGLFPVEVPAFPVVYGVVVLVVALGFDRLVGVVACPRAVALAIW